MIEVTLEFTGKQIDLLVPSEVTFHQLTQLIRDGFAARGTILPEEFSFEFPDKAITVSGYDLVSSFGIGNGERLRIVP